MIRIDPTSDLRVAPAELTGEIEIAVNGSFITLGLIDPNMAAFNMITMTIRDHSGGKIVIGTPQQIYAAGNTFASFGNGVTDLRKADRRLHSVTPHKIISLLDDTATSWNVPIGCTGFKLEVYLAGSSARCIVAFVNNGWAILYQPSMLIETSLAILTGATGNDAKVTFSFNGGKIYVENRLGATYVPYIVATYYS
ncbi:hypothetical protein [Pararhizobium sp.]|uniref:hypothetical protein n=1 Tax=Pararhizobium sp. TaxID=1977563 RepID=UPI003D0B6422